MKNLVSLVLCILSVVLFQANAQTLQLKGRASFGPRLDGTVIAEVDYFWLQNRAGAAGSLQRGMAYSALANHLYIPNRTTSPVIEGIHILDAVTGAEVFPSLDISSLTNGGTIVFIKLAAADDGAIYGMNFGSFSSSAEINPRSANTWTTIYRWGAETNADGSATAATIAFSGDPSGGKGNLQWGYGLDVRGSGTNTQILITSSSANTRNAAILTTLDGTNFNSTFVDVTNAPLGSLGPFSACSWGPGNTFWAKGTTNILQQISFTLPPRPIAAAVGGGPGPATSTNIVNTGATSGSIPIFYNFYTVPDSMHIYYENALIFDSGLVSGSRSNTVTYSGSSSQLTIIINEVGNTDLRTNFWDYTLGSTNFIQASSIRQYGADKIPTTIVPFKIHSQSNWLAGVDINTPDSVVLIDIANPSQPVILSTTNFPTDNANQFQMGSVIFGSNAVFAFDCNNGIMALDIVSSTNPAPPYVSLSPVNQYVTQPGSATFSALVGGSQPLSLQWRVAHFTANTIGTFSDIPGATNATLVIPSAQLSDEGFYHLTASNSAGQATSADVQLLVFSATNGIFTPLFGIAPNSRAYVTDNGGAATPFQRSLAYNSLSNQVIIVSRTNANTIAGISINVIDGTTGADLYQMKTNGLPNAAAAGSISLLSIAVADDGAVYIGNEVNTAAATGNQAFRVYRWSDSGSNTTFTTVFSGQPAEDAFRWGDTMHVRGSGTNTQIILDSINNTGSSSISAAVLVPSSPVLTNFISLSNGFSQTYSAGGSIGRSLQFGTHNTFWQKRKADRLALSSYDLETRTSTELASYNVFPTNVGPVTIDFSRHLAAGIYFSGVDPYQNVVIAPDMLVLYEVSDVSNPVLIGRFGFPRTPAQPNTGFIGQTVFAGNRIYALDGNNGVLAFSIPSPRLGITRSANVSTLTWTAERGWILESTPTLGAINTWTALTQSVTDGFSSVTNSNSNGSAFYRLRK